MIYLDENKLKEIGYEWKDTIQYIRNATIALNNKDYAQPIKPYLRYKNLKNRIIAMPAYVGGDIDTSGIKWIASFPDNIYHDKPRAHSVVILNEANTGEPKCIINTAMLSMIRTASVTGLILEEYKKVRDLKDLTVGIIGWGPIGQHHYKMIKDVLDDKINNILLFDKRPIIDMNSEVIGGDSKVKISDSWEKLYTNSDIVITCTVSDAPYIDMKPKKGALLLNVSLRDYKTNIYDYVKDSIIVDDWEEVCRENTDIEVLHNEKGLEENMVRTISDVVCSGCLKDYSEDENIMFNPMGMSIYDVAIGEYFLRKSREKNIGIVL